MVAILKYARQQSIYRKLSFDLLFRWNDSNSECEYERIRSNSIKFSGHQIHLLMPNSYYYTNDRNFHGVTREFAMPFNYSFPIIFFLIDLSFFLI